MAYTNATLLVFPRAQNQPKLPLGCTRPGHEPLSSAQRSLADGSLDCWVSGLCAELITFSSLSRNRAWNGTGISPWAALSTDLENGVLDGMWSWAGQLPFCPGEKLHQEQMSGSGQTSSQTCTQAGGKWLFLLSCSFLDHNFFFSLFTHYLHKPTYAVTLCFSSRSPSIRRSLF